MKREGLEMVHALQNFKNYLLGSHFKLYIDHFALKYLSNKLVLWGGGYVDGCYDSNNMIFIGASLNEPLTYNVHSSHIKQYP